MKSQHLKHILLVTVFCSSSFSFAANFTQDNVRKSQDIINATLEAYGGAEKLQQLNQVIINYQVTNTNAGQSLRPEPPWDITKGTRLDVYDFENQITMTQFNSTGGGNHFAGRNIINGEHSASLNDILKTHSPTSSPNFDVSAGPGIRTNATLLLKRLQQFAGSARYLGTTQHQSQTHDLLSFTMPGGPAITLYIDQKTHLIAKSERVSGPFLVEYFFTDYKKVDGLFFSHENAYSVDGAPTQTFSAKTYQINQPVEKLVSIPEDYLTIEATSPQDIKTSQLGDKTYWVTQNNQNSLFIEFDDHLLMVGGLPGVSQRISEIEKSVPNKPVKYAVMTHHHNDHIGGSQEIVSAGIQFISAKAHESVIRDSLEDDSQKSAKFVLIDDKKTFKDKTQRVEIYDIGPTPHAEHFLLAYVPSEGIIFEADHYGIPATGPVSPRSENIELLVSAIKKRGLKVKLIASAHSPRAATFEQLIESYNKTM